MSAIILPICLVCAEQKGRGPSNYRLRMAKNRSVVWDMAVIDDNDPSIAWCKIRNNKKCQNPLSRGGKVKSKFTTSIVKRHFEKYHPQAGCQD